MTPEPTSQAEGPVIPTTHCEDGGCEGYYQDLDAPGYRYCPYCGNELVSDGDDDPN